MDIIGTATVLGTLAAEVTNKIIHFRARTKARPTTLNPLIRHCSMLEGDAKLIAEELSRQRPGEIQADGSCRMLALRMNEVIELLGSFSKDLGDIKDSSCTTRLGHAILQMGRDDVLPEIKHFQEQIDWRSQSLQVWIPFAFHEKESSLESVSTQSFQIPTPPLTPDDRSIYTVSSRSYGHSRRQSSVSTFSDDSDNPTAQILKAARRIDVRAAKQLLEDDTTGELATTVDSAGRTLIDIVITSGKRTSKSQVPMVKLLREWGSKFTLVKHKDHYGAYQDIMNTIKFQSKAKR